MRLILCGALGVAGLVAGAASADEGFSASAGLSTSHYSENSVFGEMDLVGAFVEARVALPYRLYGMVQVRSEDGEGTLGGGTTQNDYLRITGEGGLRLSLPFGFQGVLGVNYTQTDLDIGASLGDTPFTLAVSREDYGARAGIAREFLGLVRFSADAEVSPVDEAVGGVFDLATGSRLGPWSVAFRYGLFPELIQTALTVRYSFPWNRPPRPEPDAPAQASIPAQLEPRIELAVDPQWSAPRGVPRRTDLWSAEPCARPRGEAAGCPRTPGIPTSLDAPDRRWFGPRPYP